MAYELIRKYWKWVAIILGASILIYLFVMAARFTYYMNFHDYPGKRNLVWESDSPYIRYEKIVDAAFGDYNSATCILLDGELVDTYDFIFAQGACVYICPKIESAYGPTYGAPVFSGDWGYKHGDLIVKVEKDDLFGGAYSQIVFHPVGDEP